MSSSRPSTTNYGNLGNGRPPPPQNNVEKEQLRHSEKIFLDLRGRLLSSPQHCFWGGGGKGVSIVKLLRRVCTIFVGTLSALRGKISVLSQKTNRCGCGNVQKLNYGFPGKASCASRQHILCPGRQRGAGAELFKNLTMDARRRVKRFVPKVGKPRVIYYAGFWGGRGFFLSLHCGW